MRVVPFPTRDETHVEQVWLAELEAALGGNSNDPGAISWRELCADVRGLTPVMRPEFAHELRARLDQERERPVSTSTPSRRARGLGWLTAHRPQAVAIAGGLAALIAAGAIVIPSGGGGRSPTQDALARLGVSGPAVMRSTPAHAQEAPAEIPNVAAGAGNSTAAPSSSAGSQARLQQRAASVTLGTSPGEVQTVADDVARLAASVGGYVQSSHVQVRRESSGGAEMTLSIPSAKLDSTLASLGRIAPLRAESQSTQDITSSFEAATRRLSDLRSERQALLRALSGASTQGQIDSLRERLSGVSNAIAQAQKEVQSVSRRAATSEVEVTVEGAGHGAGEGLTLHRGLHDAGHVLIVALDVLLIGAAVLVPLALVLALAFAAARVLRRQRRERILDRS
ncbi:MAG TPA: DUF4349 domain-containing protein [Solirubrobacteraceae bacterium]|jgi:hypothetical protein|nr:DUF4349 domain-containing protein [Solirubrobacteraceae bacterium]